MDIIKADLNAAAVIIKGERFFTGMAQARLMNLLVDYKIHSVEECRDAVWPPTEPTHSTTKHLSNIVNQVRKILPAGYVLRGIYRHGYVLIAPVSKGDDDGV